MKKISSWRELEVYPSSADVDQIDRQLGSMINRHESFCF